MKPRAWVRRLQALMHPRAAERELQEEVDFHLAMEARKRLAAGCRRSGQSARRGRHGGQRAADGH